MSLRLKLALFIVFGCGVAQARAESSAVPPRNTAVVDYSVIMARGWSWDLAVEAGVGLALRGDRDQRFMGRARGGVLAAREPLFFALGVTGEAGGLLGWGVGLQLAFVQSETGLSAQAGAAYTSPSRFASHLGIGFAIFGVEWMHSYERASRSCDAVFFKLHVPIGVLTMLIRKRP